AHVRGREKEAGRGGGQAAHIQPVLQEAITARRRARRDRAAAAEPGESRRGSLRQLDERAARLVAADLLTRRPWTRADLARRLVRRRGGAPARVVGGGGRGAGVGVAGRPPARRPCGRAGGRGGPSWRAPRGRGGGSAGGGRRRAGRRSRRG